MYSVNDTTAADYEAFGYSLLHKGKFAEAIKMFDKCIKYAERGNEPDWKKIAECNEIIGLCYFNEKKCQEAIHHFEQALEIDIQLNDYKRVANDISNLGITYKKLGIYDKAIDYCLQALEMDENSGDSVKIAKSLNNIGTLYDSWSKYDKAIDYYERSLKIKQSLNDSTGIALTLSNIGLVYKAWGEYEQALEYIKEALRVARASGNNKVVAMRLINLGLIYHRMKKYNEALEHYNEALNVNIKTGDSENIATIYNNIGALYKDTKDYKNAINYLELALVKYRELSFDIQAATVLSNMGDIYLKIGDYENAGKYLNESLDLTIHEENSKQTKVNYELLAKLFAAKGDHEKSLHYYKKYTAIKDTLFNAEKHRQIAAFEIMYETEKKDKEIQLMKQNDIIQELDLKKQKILRNSFLFGFAFVLILAVIIFYGLVQKRRAARTIEAEKEKSDELLLNILPAKVATDLKIRGTTEPEMFENVTVYFSDIIDFTEKSNELEPQVLISELNDIFTGFDNIIENNHCERIKTIGDAYLAVCGLPESNPKHADNIVNAALEIIEYLKARNETSKHKWQIRIGIHSGQVVGGVVGVKKYIYDVFGDAINTASRMEANSEPMRINISQTTMELVKYRFEFEDRGDIETKGKGRIKMYYVKGPKGI